MKYGELIIEKKEYEFLKQIISLARYLKDNTYKASIYKLSQELKAAKIVSKRNIPNDVVRLNSTVTIKTAFSVEKIYKIVTPDQSNIASNKISILAPMGMALFGYAENDDIMWNFPMGESAIKIVKVEQEEINLMNQHYDKRYSGTSQ